MFYSRHNERDFKIMLLQLRKQRSRFMSYLAGDLVQKRRQGADQIAQKVREQFAKNAEKFHWVCPPRAKVAVTMRFFARNNQAPALHNLVKFYLDLMSSIVFSDDRQVGCLVAQCWRPSRRYADSDRAEGSVSIEVERLTDYKRRFDLFFALLKLDGFQDHIKWNRRYRHLIDEDDLFDEIDGLWLSDAVADRLGIPAETRKAIRRLDTIERQKRLLMI